MKITGLTLALTTFAVLSTGVANAQVCGDCGASVLSYPAMVGTPACDAPLWGRHTWFDNGLDYHRAGLLGGLFGGGLLGFGGGFGYNTLGYGGIGYNALGYNGIGYGINTFSAVVPGACGSGLAAAPAVCGQRLANSVFDIRLFGLGLGFGRVSPRWDNRPAGWAF